MAKTKHIALIAGLAVLMGLVALGMGPGLLFARGSTANGTITWVIPTDKSIAISYPTALTAVKFTNATSATPVAQPADSQGSGAAPAAYRVTNNGNVAVKLTGQFSGTPPAGVSEFLEGNSSKSNGQFTGSLLSWVCTAVNDNAASIPGHCSSGVSNWTTGTMGIWTSLAAGANADKYCWTWGTAVTAGTASATLVVTSA